MSTHEHTASNSDHRTPGLWTVNGTAEYLATSRWNVYRLVRTGALPVVRVGARLRFRPDDVEAYLNRKPVP